MASCNFKLSKFDQDFIIDSGASRSVINDDFASILVLNKDADEIKTENKINLQDANGNRMICNGTVQISFSYGDTVFQEQFTRVKKLSQKVILGLDFLISNKIKVDYDKSEVIMNSKQITIPLTVTTKILDSVLFVSETVKIESNRAKFIEVNHQRNDPMVNATREGLITDLQDKFKDQNIRIQSAVVSIKNGKTQIFVQNKSSDVVLLKKNTKLAKVSHLTREKINSDSKIDSYVLNISESRDTIYNDFDYNDQDDFNPFPIPSSVDIKSEANISPELSDEQRKQVSDLLEEFSDVFTNSDKNLGCTSLFDHEIDTGNAEPVKSYPRRQSPARKQIIEDMVQKLLDANIIRKSQSEWSNPVVLVSYPGDKHRLCIDYRKLNEKTRKTVYPLPRIDEIFDMLGGSVYLTTLDLKSGYYQVPVKEQDQKKTAFITHSGLYEFKRLPFGVCNGPATFQRGMNQILFSSDHKAWEVLLDDIICFSKSFDEHMIHLRELLMRLRKANLKCSIPKCFFFYPELQYLGHVVSKDGLSPDPKKVEKLLQYPRPTTRKEVRQFLGLASYYRKFIPGFAKKSVYLTELTRENVKFEWSENAQIDFDFLRKVLSSEPVVLVHPNFDLEFKVQTDASNFAIGAILSQNDHAGRDHPIQYLSRKLRQNEIKWNTRDKEAIAIVWALDELRPYLIGKHFVLETDCKNLQWLMKAEKPQRLVRWAMRLQEYDFTINHRPGKQNGNADALSRVIYDTDTAENIGVILDNDLPSVEELVEIQNMDPNCGIILQYLKKQIGKTDQVRKLIQIKGKYLISKNSGLLQHQIGNTSPRTVVPSVVKIRILKIMHDDQLAGHTGQNKTLKKVQERFFWPNMASDVSEFVKSCPKCQIRKPDDPKSHGKLQTFPSDYPFDTVCIDILGPLPETSRFNKYVLVAIDRFSRWPELMPIQDMTAQTVADNYFENIICRHGVPRRVLSDRGTNFMSEMFKKLNARMGSEKIFTTSYHPATDGSAERIIRFISCSLTAYLNSDQNDWDLYLQSVAFAYRTSFIDGIRNSPFKLLFGRQPSLPTDVIYSDPKSITEDRDEYQIKHTEFIQKAFEEARKAQEKYTEKMKEKYDRRHKDIQFQLNDVVMLKRAVPRKNRCKKLDPRFDGPYKITEVHSRLNYTICHEQTFKTEKVHVQRLIPYNVSSLRSENEQKIYNSDLESEYTVFSDEKQNFSSDDSQKQIESDIRLIEMPGSKITETKLDSNDEQIYRVSNENISKWYYNDEIPRKMIREFKDESRKNRALQRQRR